MKNIPKKLHLQFIRDAAALITSLGFQPLPEGTPGHDRSMRIMTDYGIFTVHPPSYDFPTSLVDINGRFESPRGKSLPGDANPYSGKWNVLASDPHYVLAEFARRMKRVNAHAPTPEEQAAWDAADIIAAADLAEKRAEWAAYLAEEQAKTTALSLFA